MTNRYWVEQIPNGWYAVLVETESPRDYGAVVAAEFSTKEIAEQYRNRLEHLGVTSGDVLTIQSPAKRYGPTYDEDGYPA